MPEKYLGIVLKLLHVADTHLGASGAPGKLTPDGYGRREQDYLDSFAEIVGMAIEHKVDLFLHAGDLFHSPRPRNRIIDFALQQFAILNQAGIEAIIIAGNHDYPRVRSHGAVLKVLENVPNVTAVVDPQPHQLDYPQLSITALPFLRSQEQLEQALIDIDKLKPVNEIRVLLAHGTVHDLPFLRAGYAINEPILPIENWSKVYDYIALGHYHNCTRVKGNCYYSGANERLTVSEADNRKGCLLVEIDKQPETTFLPVKTRPMIILPEIDGRDLDGEEIYLQLEKALEEVDRHKQIVIVKVKSVSAQADSQFPFSRLGKLRQNVFELKLTLEQDQAAKSQMDAEVLAGLENEFLAYINALKIPAKERQTLSELGLEYLGRTKK